MDDKENIPMEYMEILDNFHMNLFRLNSFIESVEFMISVDAKHILESYTDELLAAVVHYNAENKQDAFVLEEMKKKLDNLNIPTKLDADNLDETLMKFTDDNYINKQIKIAKKVQMARSKSNHLYESSLITLITYFELLVGSLVKEYLKINPYILNINDKKLTYELLAEFDSIDAALEYIKEKEIEKLMFKGFNNWMTFIENKIGIKNKSLHENKDEINEIINRRHLLVHSGGIVNGIYLKKVRFAESFGVRLGDKVEVDEKYITDSLEIVKRYGNLLGICIWKSAKKESEYRLAYLLKSCIKFMEQEEYLLARDCSVLLESETIDEDLYLLAKINYWQTYKWRGEFETIKEEVENFDFSTKAKKFEIAQLILLDKYEEFMDYVNKNGLPEGIEVNDIKTWPLFKKLRLQDSFSSFITNLGRKVTENL